MLQPVQKKMRQNIVAIYINAISGCFETATDDRLLNMVIVLRKMERLLFADNGMRLFNDEVY